MSLPPLTLYLAAPRGFCAGVDRAIQIVEQALEKYGRPVYVRHEIVHNRFVVEGLEKSGAIFVDELEEVPDDAVVIFSAHGVPKSVPAEAQRRQLRYVDATCPLVSKVHREAERHHASDCRTIMIGHAGHPEVIGTMGQLPDGVIRLVENVADVESLPESSEAMAYITQTTLSVDETADIVSALRQRFPQIIEPRKEDICYATTNRQAAVKALAEKCDAFFVVGAPNSSNSLRLVESARRSGCQQASLLRDHRDINWDALEDVKTVGLSAGASAPDILVQEVIQAFQERYDVSMAEHRVAEENITFKMPAELR